MLGSYASNWPLERLTNGCAVTEGLVLSSSTILNLPNLITFLRIGAIPLFLILLTDQQYTEALIVFVLAGVTDSIDGAVARLTNSHTALGAYIDPLADKLLLVSSFLILAFPTSI